MTKPATTEMFKPEYEGERPDLRKASLLAGNLAYLMALEANGLDQQADALVDKIEAGLARKPGPGRVIAADPITLPPEERGRSEFDLRRLDQINARLLRGYRDQRGKSAAEQREDDLRRRAELENEIAARTEERRRLEAMAEADLLAAARGEEVETERSGLRRVLDRDPLLSLSRAGALTNEQFEAGLAVRELYDLRTGDAASAPFDGMPAGSHDHERFVGNRYLRAKATVPIGQLETAILNGHFRTVSGALLTLDAWPGMIAAGMEPIISLRVLRWVCGEHKSLRSLGQGRAYDRHRCALQWALDTASEVLDLRRTSPRT
jgi:hypothetical protein